MNIIYATTGILLLLPVGRKTAWAMPGLFTGPPIVIPSTATIFIEQHPSIWEKLVLTRDACIILGWQCDGRWRVARFRRRAAVSSSRWRPTCASVVPALARCRSVLPLVCPNTVASRLQLVLSNRCARSHSPVYSSLCLQLVRSVRLSPVRSFVVMSSTCISAASRSSVVMLSPAPSS